MLNSVDIDFYHLRNFGNYLLFNQKIQSEAKRLVSEDSVQGQAIMSVINTKRGERPPLLKGR